MKYIPFFNRIQAGCVVPVHLLQALEPNIADKSHCAERVNDVVKLTEEMLQSRMALRFEQSDVQRSQCLRENNFSCGSLPAKCCPTGCGIQ